MSRATARLGELLPDNPDRDNPGLVRAENVIPHRTSYQPINNLIAETVALDGLCRGAVAATDELGVIHNYAGTRIKLYERDGVNWDDISRTIAADPIASSADDYDIPADHNWSFIRFYHFPSDTMNMLAANGVDVLQEQLSFGGRFEDMVKDPDPDNVEDIPTLRYLAPVREFCVGGWTSSRTSLVKWSAQGNHRIWTATLQQSGEQVLSRGGQVTGVVGGEYGVIFCENSIYRMNYTGEPNIVFQFDEVSPGHGTTAPGSIAQYGDNIYFIDADGFYVFNGATATPIGSNKINDTFLKDYDAEFANRVISAIDIGKSLVWWAYPSLNARSDAEGQKVPDKIIVYDWTTGRFAGPINLEVEELIYARTEASYLLDDILVANFPGEATISDNCYGNGPDGTCIDLDQFDYQVDAEVFKGGNIQMLAFNFDHRQATFTGSPLTAIIETGEFSLNEGGLAFVTGIRALVDGEDPSIQIRVGCRQNTYGEVTWSLAKTPHPVTGLANFRKNARYHRVELTVGNDFEHIFGGDIEFQDAGYK